jgi:hypothetical protein
LNTRHSSARDVSAKAADADATSKQLMKVALERSVSGPQGSFSSRIAVSMSSRDWRNPFVQGHRHWPFVPRATVDDEQDVSMELPQHVAVHAFHHFLEAASQLPDAVGKATYLSVAYVDATSEEMQSFLEHYHVRQAVALDLRHTMRGTNGLVSTLKAIQHGALQLRFLNMSENPVLFGSSSVGRSQGR